MNVLLIEDDGVDVMAVERALNGLAFHGELFHAADVEAATVLLEERGGEIDLILLDLNLPGRSGHEFLDAVRSGDQPATAPVIVLTSSADSYDLDRCFGSAAAGYFVKPLAADELTATLKTILSYWSASLRPTMSVSR